MENKFYSEDDLIPVSALSDFVFCKRRAALHFIEGIVGRQFFLPQKDDTP